MNERAYKAMSFAGAVNIAVGIVIAVVGVAAGVLAIISGARLLREKKGLTFYSKPLKFMAERGRFELPVPFEYTRFPIVLLRPARTPLRVVQRCN